MSLRIAFYGVGDRARPYLDALARRREVELCAVCDIDRRSAEQTAAGWGAQVFLSYEPMLQQAQPDALWISVPPHLQGDVLLRAVQQRIPFFIEAPGAMNFDRARQYARLVSEARLVSAVGFPAHHVDITREGREYLGTNVVPLALGWWLRPAHATSATSALALLWNEACHLVDLLRYFCGAVASVQACPAGPGEEPGGLVVQLRFVRGTVGVLTLATFPRPGPRVELELLGEGWTLTLDEGPTWLRVAEHDKTTTLRSLTDLASEQVGAFLQAVATGDPSLVPASYADALDTLTICDAAIRSAREATAINLTEPDRS